MTDWVEDNEYVHPSLDWLHRYIALKSGNGRTAKAERYCKIESLQRLMELAHMEHADCEDTCEVRIALATLHDEFETKK
jgi:hypothetical protein